MKANELEAVQPNRNESGQADSKRQCVEEVSYYKS